MSDLVARLRDADTTRRIGESYADTHERRQRDRDEAAAEIERLRAALREIDHARYTGRNTINPDNAFEHAISLNEKLIAVMDIARAALEQEKPNE
jgi:hypothetical protein